MLGWHEWWSARWTAARCTAVGSGARFEGRPFIRNAGEIILGNGVEIRSLPVRTHLFSGPEGRIVIGDHACIAHGVAIASRLSIVIGKGTVIGPYAVLLDIDFNEVRNRGAVGTARPISIGRNVRIGAGVVVLRGAVIEDDVRVAPHSVVGRRIPAGSQVGGVPAAPRQATSLRPR